MYGLFSASFTIAPFALHSPVSALFAIACSVSITTAGMPIRRSRPSTRARAGATMRERGGDPEDPDRRGRLGARRDEQRAGGAEPPRVPGRA